MSDESGAGFFSAPPFNPGDALLQLRRALRGLGGLTERGPQFELKGRPVVTLGVDGAQLLVRLALRPAVRPEWETRALKSSADVRKFSDDVKQRVTGWKDADD